jgi:hypothetical protein
MGPIYSVSLAVLIFIFAAGFAVGWMWSRTRIRDSTKPSMSPSAFDGPKVESKKSVRLLELKCQCGETLKFRDPPDSSQPEFLPYPESDFVTCPKCGRAKNLAEVQAFLNTLPPR